MTRGTIAGVPVEISRTGYTGDLGYEIWMPWDRAVDVWDALMAGGRAFDIHAAGMLALDVARVEAGLLLIDVDFFSSKKALIESQKYSPFEMGLGRLVQLDTRPVRRPRGAASRSSAADRRGRSSASRSAGRRSKRSTRSSASRRRSPPTASRIAVPVYRGGRQVGRATTTTWSPVLKKLIALATVAAPHIAEGTALEFEVTVEAVRHRVPATVVKTPFFNPRARRRRSRNQHGSGSKERRGPGRDRKPSSARTCRRISTARSRRSTPCTPRLPAACAATCCRSAATRRSPTICCRRRSCRSTGRAGPTSRGVR